MLKLKKVELHGFKSFCDRTEMRFNGGGVAAIVGPNGCGKSNLSDAISWVLGEQSAKLLRGTRMEDVIFNGTRDRKPIGMAAVTLTLIDPEVYFLSSAAPANGSNGRNHGNGKEQAHPEGALEPDSLPPEKPGEIVVTRRLFRSGESEYLLNGRICRLRDIQEIFMGTGLGPESYAIIEQGRIGQILSSRPYDRRAVVEEAAGITKFKAKKKLAEARLESARQNLSRVSDILEEVGRQANSLKRQAAKARRYEQLRQEMIAKLGLVLGGRHFNLNCEAKQVTLALGTAADDLRLRSSRISQMETEHETAQKASRALEEQLQTCRGELSDAAMEAEAARQRHDYQAKSAEEDASRIRRAEEEVASHESRLEKLRRELEEATAVLETVTDEMEVGREQVAGRTAELQSLQLQAQAREARQEELRQQVVRLLGEASSLRNQLAQIEEFLAGLDRQTTRLRGEETAAAEEGRSLEGLRQRLAAELREQQDGLALRLDRLRALDAGLNEARGQAAAKRERVDTLRHELSRLEARRHSLEGVLSHRAYTTEAVKNLFAAMEQGRLGDFRVQGILADFIEVEPKYERAVEEFLREELEYLVVSDWDKAEQGMHLLRAEMEGCATFLVASQPETASGFPLPVSETGILGRLSDSVRFSNSALSAALLPRLERCYLADDDEAARRFCNCYPDLYFLLADGRYYHGRLLTGGRKASSGPLALKRELREVASLCTAQTQELASETGILAALDETVAGHSQQIEALRAEIQRSEKEVLAGEQNLRHAGERLQRVESQLSVTRLEIGRLAAEGERASEERRRALQDAEEKERGHRHAEEAISGLREAAARDQQQLAFATEQLTALRAGLAALEERYRGAMTSKARAKDALSEEAQRRDQRAEEIVGWAAERKQLLDSNMELERQIAGLENRRADLAQEAKRMEVALADHRNRMAAVEESLRTEKQELESARERRSELEIQLVRLQSDLRHLEETCQRELGRAMDKVSEEQGVVLEPEAMAAAEQEYQGLKEKIEALGPVNVLALEEFQETQQRFEFLETQRQDLVDSIRDTQQAIGEIDSVSRRQFLEAFEEINRHFRATFTTLFGGGHGEMRLTDEANIAESGIDIVASPPGKKLQNVLLLSGGEKALTALALLMGVFRYQPSPFCILDEVDAPLDDANVIRFTRLIREMSEQTQFILITHNKSTMGIAETLYGVTMQEPGVSRLVSVKLGDASRPDRRPLVPAPSQLTFQAARV